MLYIPQHICAITVQVIRCVLRVDFHVRSIKSAWEKSSALLEKLTELETTENER